MAFISFGFPMAFLNRQELLQILYDSFPKKSNIYVDKTVVRVEHKNQNCVLVHTQDGRSYKGDLVVGADGVHSCVRTQMWQIADKLRPGMIPIEEKKGKCSPQIFKHNSTNYRDLSYEEG